MRVPVEHAGKFVRAAKQLGKSEIVQYYELENAGGAEHWSNATEQQISRMAELSEINRKNNRKLVEIPDCQFSNQIRKVYQIASGDFYHKLGDIFTSG